MSTKAQGSITITLDGTNKSTTLPLLGGTLGPQVADIRKLYGDLGIFTFDPGYGATASCESTITYIDGDAGVLLYRGYPIEELAEKSSFLEVAWLLMNGELPTRQELEGFRTNITRHTLLHEDFRRFFDALPKDAHPMPVLAATVGALATFACLAASERITRLLGQTGINVMTRLMGLILAALAVEVMADGLHKLFPVLASR